MAKHKGVMICAELVNKEISAITTELLGIGRKLADDLGEELSALLMGSEVTPLSQEHIAYGADRVYLVDDPLLKSFNSDAYTGAAANVCRQVNPSIVLLGQTDMGRELAPRLTARLGGGLAMDCIDLSIDPETKLMLQTRPVFGGNAYAVMVTRIARPQIATVRPKTMLPLERDGSREGEVVSMEAGIDSSIIKAEIIETVKEDVEGVKLEEAEIIVTGGRGIGSAEGFAVVRELAMVLGGATGATRGACDEGMAPATMQVGQTGKIVSPNLYIAVALSGAVQHLAGCSGSKHIVAINKDPEAHIFKVAEFGIVADYKEVLPVLTEKCKELLAS
ncbi:MAG: electron transfer flavoprotein subunit alpha/FixB family protein [Dehalococcoidia bacterium]|nr:electron transfer flavoprotein subunit alpha/FixB family protein [Dehalococcoidia bacterium]